MSKADTVELLHIMDAEIELNNKGRLKRLYDAMYPWQRRFVATTLKYDSSMLMASNQCVTGSTPILVKQGKEEKWLPFLETLSSEDVRVRSWADGSLHDACIEAAYFQGILPSFRLYLSNGQCLDCSDGHEVLDAEGNYRTILSLVSQTDGQHYYQTSEDYQANCGEGDYRDGQPLPQASGIDPALFPLLDDALRCNQMAASQMDEEERTDLHSLVSQYGDLLTNQDALSHVSDLSGRFASCSALPPEKLMSGLLQASRQLYPEESYQPQPSFEVHSGKSAGCYEAYSNRIYFPRPISLMNDVSIIAWAGIGLQPCYDYSIPDFNNYVSAGVVSHNSGKSRTGCIIDAYHLTGDYPDDYEGLKFDFAPLCWLLGYSGEKTRDLLQKKLFGRLKEGKFEGGYIPADQIVDYISMSATSGACREVRVKHKHGIAVCQFWSYSQGQHALMGDCVDWFHIDEEPEDEEIYPQVVTRTLNGNKGKGGAGILTFTPENGKTELVCQFMDEPEEGMHLMGATWDECPHMTEEKKRKFLAKYPAHQRDMRSKGTPLMGSGLIYDVDEDLIKCDPFQIPEYWFVINGMDFGWTHPQAHVQLVWDRDNDIYYLTNAWKGSEKQPFEAWHIVRPWAADIPTAWPADGLQHEKGSAKQQKSYYEEEGWLMLPDHATWPSGDVGVWAGITELKNAMDTGRFKVFSNLFEAFIEIREYHTVVIKSGERKGGVKIVKTKDDILDAIRYAYMMRRHAIRICDINPEVYNHGQPTQNPGQYDNF